MKHDPHSVPAAATTVQQLDLLDQHDDRPEDRVTFDDFWRDGAQRALIVLAETGEPFTADALRDEPFCLPEPRHPNHLGALFSAASKAGLIKRVGYVASPTPSRRHSVVSLWRGGAPRRAALIEDGSQ